MKSPLFTRMVLGISIVLTTLALRTGSAGVTVTIPDTAASTSPTIIPINVDNAAGIAGFQFKVTFNPDIVTPGTIQSGTLNAGWMIFFRYGSIG